MSGAVTAASDCRSVRALHRVTLKDRKAIGSAYHVLTFESAEPIVASAGQFAMVRSETWGSAPLLPRPMSLLSAGKDPSILIKVVGEGTRRMAASAPGEPYQLLAPLGKSWSKIPAATRPVFVAGGVGVAPLLLLAEELASAGGPKPLVLYGGRTAHDLPLLDQLRAVSDVRIATEDGSAGTKGRVTVLLSAALDEVGVHNQLAKVYTCGPHAMMAAVAAMCEGRVPCEVSVETPMGCGYGVCLGCPVPKVSGGFLYACTEGPCLDATVIDWGHRKAGA
ncbi:MAG: dihydroorotate dehydrogenase electron transfer subunit [Polyangiaceae bacterium]|nr:dihydroorotate dehydrogenase electron transfer subunit [Polyangiaceae bacterium]